jgi:hypothetical protein
VALFDFDDLAASVSIHDYVATRFAPLEIPAREIDIRSAMASSWLLPAATFPPPDPNQKHPIHRVLLFRIH